MPVLFSSASLIINSRGPTLVTLVPNIYSIYYELDNFQNLNLYLLLSVQVVLNAFSVYLFLVRDEYNCFEE
ncbi:hypothetical protein VCR17J2_350164 [Vibrio coralliirubri]|nr:hypothetical protein VCR17J2_350164 [Vibrio coralliirubri]